MEAMEEARRVPGVGGDGWGPWRVVDMRPPVCDRLWRGCVSEVAGDRRGGISPSMDIVLVHWIRFMDM